MRAFLLLGVDFGEVVLGGRMKHHRRRLILLAGALAVSRLALAQPAAKVHRVGVLSIGTDPANPGRWEHFLDAMRQLNYVEGRNVDYVWGFGAGNFGRLPDLLATFQKAGVDVILVTGTREIRAAMKATATTPIVMTLAIDPIKEGFISSLARPGGNVTGLTGLIPGLSQKYVELLREVVPTAKRIGVIGVAPNPIPEIRREMEEATRKLGLAMTLLQPRSPADFDRVMGEARKDGVAGIVHPIDGGTSAYRPQLVQAALKHGLPGIYWDAAYVDAGGLMTYSINWEAQMRRAAVFIDKILRGAKPADLPVEQPARVELVINMKTARALGIQIPRSILLRADRLVE
jgi:putative tryptophan/tyrosine transport system substrate-binding protein